MKRKFIGIIPARYESTRLPGKPLLDIGGKPMIQHVYERAKLKLKHVYVATDDRRIYEAVIKFGGKVVVTGKCKSGTDRCLAALNTQVLQRFHLNTYDIIINIQGDEPLFPIEYIELLKKYLISNYLFTIATIAFKQRVEREFVKIGNDAYVVINKKFRALYFSRYLIPYSKNEYSNVLKHVGIYAYTLQALKRFCQLSKSKLENLESLEQNRWLENGSKIKVIVTDIPSPNGIDTLEDLEEIRNYLKY